MQGQMEIFHVGSHRFREWLRELLRELWLSCCSSREMPFREWNFVFREWNFQFRELLREHPGTLPELREWPFHSESVFPEIGVVPRLLTEGFLKGVLEGLQKGSTEDPSKPLQSAFINPPKTLQEGVEIDDALGFPGALQSVPGSGAPVAGNESLDAGILFNMHLQLSKYRDSIFLFYAAAALELFRMNVT